MITCIERDGVLYVVFARTHMPDGNIRGFDGDINIVYQHAKEGYRDVEDLKRMAEYINDCVRKAQENS